MRSPFAQGAGTRVCGVFAVSYFGRLCQGITGADSIPLAAKLCCVGFPSLCEGTLCGIGFSATASSRTLEKDVLFLFAAVSSG